MNMARRGDFGIGKGLGRWFAAAGGILAAGTLWAGQASADIVHNDDVIITFSLCVGSDCVNGESFGFDTIRLKENNLRIKFQDTSNSGSFPTQDWQLTANDSANGGLNKFSIDAISPVSSTPFTIEAGAPSHSLYVDDGGRIGLGTNQPVVELHIIDGDTPTLRLQQDGSSGFTPQTWDVAGNETNFFVRDATNGSTLPFKIQPGTASNTLYLASDEQIGMGTTSPDAPLEVHATASNIGTGNAVVKLVNTGGAVAFQMDPNDNGTFWNISATADDTTLNFSRSGTGNTEMSIDDNGDLTTSGTVNGVSSRFVKENFKTLSADETLQRIRALDVVEWNYISQAQKTRHIGPMAEDFYAAFGVGVDDKHISLIDLSGVSLLAIKALDQQLQERDQTIAALQARLQALEERSTTQQKN